MSNVGLIIHLMMLWSCGEGRAISRLGPGSICSTLWRTLKELSPQILGRYVTPGREEPRGGFSAMWGMFVAHLQVFVVPYGRVGPGTRRSPELNTA